MNWIENASHLIGFNKYKFEDINSTNNKIAGFDLDLTLIRPTNGKKFSDSVTDWEFFDDSKIKLKNYHNDGYKIVIITNQNGIGIGKVNKDVWKKKIELFASKIKIPFVIFAAMQKDEFRKPYTGLWNKYIKCDFATSFYCGDSAGLPKRRIKGQVIKKDISDSDLKFALNIGIKFMHRDEFIFGIKQDIIIDYPIDFNNIKYGKYSRFIPLDKQEMIIMVGYPGSGKSYYVKNYIVGNNKNYVRINQDTLKTKQKCLKVAESEIRNNKSVVIDNTNPSKDDRKLFINLAKKYNISCRCIHFITSKNISNHNNHYRGGKIVPKIAYNIFTKRYCKPSINEGFVDILEMDFVIDNDNCDMTKYKKYYI